MKKYRLIQFINNQRIKNEFSYLLRNPGSEMGKQARLRPEFKLKGESAEQTRKIRGWHEYEYNPN